MVVAISHAHTHTHPFFNSVRRLATTTTFFLAGRTQTLRQGQNSNGASSVVDSFSIMSNNMHTSVREFYRSCIVYANAGNHIVYSVRNATNGVPMLSFDIPLGAHGSPRERNSRYLDPSSASAQRPKYIHGSNLLSRADRYCA
jgi:hypothetical protein